MALSDVGQILGQLTLLVWTLSSCVVVMCVVTPWLIVKNLWISLVGPCTPATVNSVQYYEGVVVHRRRKPVDHSFKYAVRMAMVSLDTPPAWFSKQAKDHMTAQQAREAAGTDGPVDLLTHPVSFGYLQNPISVYYCRSKEDGAVIRCIAEVTNTPWADR